MSDAAGTRHLWLSYVSLLGVFLMTLIATACDPAAQPSPSGPTVTPTSTQAAPTALPGSGPAIPVAQINATGMGPNTPSQVWTQDGGTVVGLVVEQSGCEHVSAQLNAQTSTTVEITIIDTLSNKAGQMCPMIVREDPLAVRLAAPLGNRMLVLKSVTQHG